MDFFDDEDGGGLQRDQWGRPLLRRADGTLNDDPRYATRHDGRWPYTRASSLSDHLSDRAGLHVWQQRNLARGLGRREDLAALAASVPDEHPTDKKLNKASNAILDEVIAGSWDASGANGGRNYGSAFHALTEPGAYPEVVPERMQADVAAFNECLRANHILIKATEQFVANDSWMAAGTFDHLVNVPGYGLMVADKKTAKQPKPLDYAIQMAIYAGGTPYDGDTDERGIPLPEQGVRQDYGLLFWSPRERGICEPILIDLEMGRRGCQLALDVKEYRTWTAHEALKPYELSKLEVAGDIKSAIADAPDRRAVQGIVNVWKDHPAWSAEHAEAAREAWRKLS